MAAPQGISSYISRTVVRINPEGRAPQDLLYDGTWYEAYYDDWRMEVDGRIKRRGGREHNMKVEGRAGAGHADRINGVRKLCHCLSLSLSRWQRSRGTKGGAMTARVVRTRRM